MSRYLSLFAVGLATGYLWGLSSGFPVPGVVS